MQDNTILNSPLVQTGWLASHLTDSNLRIVDASYFLPAHQRDAVAEFAAGRIPGSIRFDIDAVKDTGTDLPHMLPSVQEAERAFGAMGIGPDTHVVIYDRPGIPSAARLWWMLKVFGHDRAAVLDGGWPKWLAEDRPVQTGHADVPPPRNFAASPRPELVWSAKQIVNFLAEMPDKANSVQIVDARGLARFNGQEPEPRAGLRSGHIPGSKNLPFTVLLAPDGTFLPPDQIRKIFQKAGIDGGRRIIASCGSGITACAIALASDLSGGAEVGVYDGSWAEWGGRPDLPVMSTKASE